MVNLCVSYQPASVLIGTSPQMYLSYKQINHHRCTYPQMYHICAGARYLHLSHISVRTLIRYTYTHIRIRCWLHMGLRGPGGGGGRVGNLRRGQSSKRGLHMPAHIGLLFGSSIWLPLPICHSHRVLPLFGSLVRSHARYTPVALPWLVSASQVIITWLMLYIYIYI